MSERDLGNLVERAYVGEGGTTFIHYIGVTSMKEPGIVVPPQFHSARRVAAGQVLRSFTVGAEPTPLYKRLHETGMTLEENMTVVVQPNVISPKDNAGAQVGELIRVTRTGFERLHSAPRGFFRA